MTRISLQQAFSQGLRGILNTQSQLFRTQDQVSTGRRVLTPSDDPVAAARILQLEQSASEIAQYKKNIAGATTSLETEGTQLTAVSSLLVRVRELTVQAGDGVLQESDRKAIHAELTNILDQLGSIANTRNSSGEYIFGGYKGQSAPFIKNGTSYDYVGDDGQRLVQISSSTSVAITDSGNDVFVDVRSPRLATTAATTPPNTGNATMSSGHIADQAAYTAGFSGSYQINFTSPTTYDIVDSTGTTVPPLARPYTSGDMIAFNGVEFRVTGTPAAGDSFQIDPPATQSIIDTVAKMVDALASLGDNVDDNLRLKDIVAETLDNLGSAETNIGVIQSRVGARLNTLDSTSDLHEGIDEVNQKVLADVRDLDYAEAVTRLTKEKFILEAAQQTFAKIGNLSLFNFLR